MAYRLSQDAQRDLIDIFLEGLVTFGQAQAERYYAGLHGVFDFLSQNPRAARLRNEIDPPTRFHPYKSHIVAYVLEGNDVFIIRIRHSHEDWVNTSGAVND